MTEENLRETLRFEQVVDLRDKTEKVAKFLVDQLKEYLETLRPLLAPVRVFGKHTRSPVWDDVPGAENAVRKLCEKFSLICGKPFSLPPDLGETAVADLDGRLELYPWEYTHEVRDGNEIKPVIVTSPVKNVLTYRSSYSLSQMRAALAGKGDRRQDDVREFVVAALAMQSLWDKFPGIARLLKDLRYEVQIEKCPGLGDLPLVVISSCVPSFRPSDEMVLATTRLTGVAAFIELIDINAIQQLQDPLKPRLENLTR